MKVKCKMLKVKSKKRGFALLIAVIVSTIILTIGLSIINTALKEIILASTVRNSLTSFYIADTGAGCALYWDNIRGNFEKVSGFTVGSPPSMIECQHVKIPVVPADALRGVWLRDDEHLSKPCAEIEFETTSVGTREEKVFLRSWGFNTCDVTNQRRVDRALEVKYSRFR